MNEPGRSVDKDHQFSTDFFNEFSSIWREIISRLKPQRILEIGSYEGRSTCFIIEECSRHAPIEIHCLDTFAGSIEHERIKVDVTGLEDKFDLNTQLAIEHSGGSVRCKLVKHKQPSLLGLAKLLAEGHAGTFDLIYVDGSHLAHDVLADLVLSFELLRNGGTMVADDYLWYERIRSSPLLQNLTHPKPAIDAFVNINHFRLAVLQAPLYQQYIVKTGP